MIKRMNKLLKELDKKLELTGEKTYYKTCKILSLNDVDEMGSKFTHEYDWLWFDANGKGAHITYKYHVINDRLVLFIDGYELAEK